MTDEQLRLRADFKDNASSGVRRLRKNLDDVKPTHGMAAARKWFDEFRLSADKANQVVKPISGYLGDIGIGGLAAGFSLGEMVKQFKQLADQTIALKEIGRQTGLTATQVKQLQNVASQLSIDPSKMTSGLQVMSDHMYDFRRHVGELYGVLNQFDPDFARKLALDAPEQALKDYVDWLAKIPEQQRAIGKSAADAAEIQRRFSEAMLGDGSLSRLAATPGEFAAAWDSATKKVAPVTDEMERQARLLNDAVVDLNSAWDRLKTDVGPSVVSAITGATDKLRIAFDAIHAHPVESATAAGGMAALFARYRILRSGGMNRAAMQLEGAAAKQQGAGTSLAEAARELTGAATSLREAAAELRARGGAIPGTEGAGSPSEPSKPGGTSPGYTGLGGRALFLGFNMFGAALGMDDALKRAETDNAPVDPELTGEAGLGDQLRKWMRGASPPASPGSAGFGEDTSALHRDEGFGPPPAASAPFRVPAAYDREMRARSQGDGLDHSLDGVVVGSLGREVIHLHGTLRTLAKSVEDSPFRQAAFHPGGTSGENPSAFDLLGTITAGTKAGTIAAWREMLQEQELGKHSEDGSGGPGGPSIRFGRSPSGGYRRGGHSGGGKFYPDTPDGAGHGGKVQGDIRTRSLAAMDYLVTKKGWNPEGAAIAVGNAMQESGVSSTGGVGDPSVPGGSHKMFQWNRERWAAFRAFARSRSKSVDDFETNLDFFDDERKRRSGLEAQWDKQRDLHNAGRLGHLYEGYGDNSEGTRIQNARNVLDLWRQRHQGGATPAPATSIGAHADGGLISGPGGPRSDSIFALLSNREFVVNAAATQRHLPLLHAINSGASLPGYADGGLVASGAARRRSWLDFFRRPSRDGGMGASRAVALGATAMMNGESGFGLDPTLYHWDVNGPSGGTAQWHDVTKGAGAGKLRRLSDLMTFAMMQHADWHEVPLQQAWWKHEANGSLRYAWDAMRRARTAAGALHAGIDRFEVPADKEREFHKRMPNIMRLARESAGGKGSQAPEIDPIRLDIHHHQDGRVRSIRATGGKGSKVHLVRGPTFASASETD